MGAKNEGSWGEESVHVSDAQAAVDLLRSELRPGDVVLVKASRSVGLESVAQALLATGRGSEGGRPMMKQILFSGVIGLFLTLIGTPLLIKLLARKGYGQYIRDDGPRDAPQQARHAHHGRHRLHPGDAHRLRADQGDHGRANPPSPACWCSS